MVYFRGLGGNAERHKVEDFMFFVEVRPQPTEGLQHHYCMCNTAKYMHNAVFSCTVKQCHCMRLKEFYTFHILIYMYVYFFKRCFKYTAFT